MHEYIIGNIIEKQEKKIILENNDIGYIINVASIKDYEIGKMKVYIYKQTREEETKLYGFKTKEEKELFLKLITVKGLGCNIATNIIGSSPIEEIKKEIERENIMFFKRIPKVGEKLARQIILDLRGKIVNNVSNIELEQALKNLGYKSYEIIKVITKINPANSIEEQIKEALKNMNRRV